MPTRCFAPGGFGRVRFQTGMNEGALLVPQAAVIEVQSMYQVAVVGTWATRPPSASSRWAIASARTGSSPKD